MMMQKNNGPQKSIGMGGAPDEYNEYGVHLWVLVHGFQGNS